MEPIEGLLVKFPLVAGGGLLEEVAGLDQIGGGLLLGLQGRGEEGASFSVIGQVGEKGLGGLDGGIPLAGGELVLGGDDCGAAGGGGPGEGDGLRHAHACLVVREFFQHLADGVFGLIPTTCLQRSLGLAAPVTGELLVFLGDAGLDIAAPCGDERGGGVELLDGVVGGGGVVPAAGFKMGGGRGSQFCDARECLLPDQLLGFPVVMHQNTGRRHEQQNKDPCEPGPAATARQQTGGLSGHFSGRAESDHYFFLQGGGDFLRGCGNFLQGCGDFLRGGGDFLRGCGNFLRGCGPFCRLMVF